MLPYQIKNKELEKLPYRKKNIKLSTYLNYSCSLHVECLYNIWTFLNKNTASYGVVSVTLIKINF